MKRAIEIARKQKEEKRYIHPFSLVERAYVPQNHVGIIECDLSDPSALGRVSYLATCGIATCVGITCYSRDGHHVKTLLAHFDLKDRTPEEDTRIDACVSAFIHEILPGANTRVTIIPSQASDPLLYNFLRASIHEKYRGSEIHDYAFTEHKAEDDTTPQREPTENICIRILTGEIFRYDRLELPATVAGHDRMALNAPRRLHFHILDGSSLTPAFEEHRDGTEDKADKSTAAPHPPSDV